MDQFSQFSFILRSVYPVHNLPAFNKNVKRSCQTPCKIWGRWMSTALLHSLGKVFYQRRFVFLMPLKILTSKRLRPLQPKLLFTTTSPNSSWLFARSNSRRESILVAILSSCTNKLYLTQSRNLLDSPHSLKLLSYTVDNSSFSTFPVFL